MKNLKNFLLKNKQKKFKEASEKAIGIEELDSDQKKLQEELITWEWARCQGATTRRTAVSDQSGPLAIAAPAPAQARRPG